MRMGAFLNSLFCSVPTLVPETHSLLKIWDRESAHEREGGGAEGGGVGGEGRVGGSADWATQMPPEPHDLN